MHVKILDDTIPADSITTTCSYGQYTDEQWKIVKLMPNIESIKWTEPTFSEKLPNLIMEVKPELSLPRIYVKWL